MAFVTITAFTLAHSITMAGATLRFVQLAQVLVEAVIALIIRFLVMEIVRETGLASQYSWLIAWFWICRSIGRDRTSSTSYHLSTYLL